MITENEPNTNDLWLLPVIALALGWNWDEESEIGMDEEFVEVFNNAVKGVSNENLNGEEKGNSTDDLSSDVK